jgi:peptide methionine sulfoxide reductase MsrB
VQGASHVLAGGRSRNGRRYHINSAALGLVPYEDLRAEVYGAYRNLRNQAAATKGAKQ